MSANLEINVEDNASKDLATLSKNLNAFVKSLDKLASSANALIKTADAINKATGQSEKLANTQKKLEKSTEDVIPPALEMKGAMDDLKKVAKVTATAFKFFVGVLKPVGKVLGFGAKAFGKAAKAAVKFSKSLVSGTLKAGMKGLTAGLSLVGLKLTNVDEGFGRLAKGGIGKLRQALSDLIRGGLQRATRALIDFTRTAFAQFSQLDKAGREIAIFAGTVDRDFGNFNQNADVYRKSITSIAKSTIFSSDQIAGAMSEIASIGQFETPEQLQHLTNVAAKLATATGADISFAGELLARTMNAFSSSLEGARSSTGQLLTEQEKVVAVSNILARAANDSALSMAQLGDAMQYVSPLAVAAGISLEESVSMVAALSNMGFNASRAGTAVAQALEALTAPSAGAAKAMASIDFTAFDEQGNMKEMGVILMELQNRLQGLATDEEKLAIMQEMFGTRAGRAMNALLNDTNQYANLLQALAQDSAEGFNLIEEANKAMMLSVAGQISILEGSLDDLRVKIMSALEPLLVNEDGSGFLQTLNATFENPAFISSMRLLTRTLAYLTTVFNDLAGEVLIGLVGSMNAFFMLVGIVIQTLRELFNTTENGMSAFDMFASVIMSIIAALQQAIPVLIPIIVNMLSSLFMVFEALMNNFDPLLGFLVIFADFLADLLATFAPVFVNLINLIGRFAPTIMQFVSSVFDAVMIVADAFIPVIEDLIAIIMQNEESIIKIIKGMGDFIKIIALLAKFVINLARVFLEILAPSISNTMKNLALFFDGLRVVGKRVGTVTKILGEHVKAILMTNNGYFEAARQQHSFFREWFENSGAYAATVTGITNLFIELAKAIATATTWSKLFIMPWKSRELLYELEMTKRELDASKVSIQEVQKELDELNNMDMAEFSFEEFDFDDLTQSFEDFEIEIDLDSDALKELQDEMDETNLAFPVDADFTNMEVEDGVVQLAASTDLQDQVDQAEQLFGSISNILAVQEVAGALLGQAVNNMNGEGAGNGGAGDTITDNSVNNSNNTSVDNVNVYITPDGTLDRDSDATTAESAIDVLKAVAGGL